MNKDATQVALAALKDKISHMPYREELMGGQVHKYLNRAEVIGWIEEALKAEQATAGDAVKCVRCGCMATHELRPPQITDEWSPYCASCMNDEYATCEAVAHHEISNFGGAYGVPTLESRALTPQSDAGEVDHD